MFVSKQKYLEMERAASWFRKELEEAMKNKRELARENKRYNDYFSRLPVHMSNGISIFSVKLEGGMLLLSVIADNEYLQIWEKLGIIDDQLSIYGPAYALTVALGIVEKALGRLEKDDNTDRWVYYQSMCYYGGCSFNPKFYNGVGEAIKDLSVIGKGSFKIDCLGYDANCKNLLECRDNI